MSLHSAVSAKSSHSWLGLTLPKALTTPSDNHKAKLQMEISLDSSPIYNIIQASVNDDQL